ncbi:MAG: tRNA (N6-isopentenyl adenosine(37)-C2)-methylthiotransferase MiaB [Deltaproteobacteria bacterium]|nr:tRNA (N6-isopentenyl adenosine(37)-C2)-methylthiotransferase MiaB [Deltaproteobacteria bacterium]
MKTKRVHIITMGCQMNVYDSEQMERLLATMNYRPTSHQEKADLIILNTCSIRDKAEHKVYSHLGRLARLKLKRPNLVIGVGGCVAQQEGDRLLKRAPHVDIVFGTFSISRLPSLIRRVTHEKKQAVDVEPTGTVEPSHIKPTNFQEARAKAFVTIIRGCDNFCTYCVVPYLRGRELSRRPQRILEEIRHLVARGVREVTLLGQNVNSYGLKNGHSLDFPALLEAVNDVEGLRRLRFTTSHPKDLSDKLIRAFGRLDKLAPHIHLPVQSGSDRILKRMNRGYTRGNYLARIEKLRKAQPNIAITSDIIVGFPGEGETDFEETLNLVESVGFDNLYIFKYSNRKNTPAFRFSDKVQEAVKGERFARLLELQSKITLDKNRALVGTVQEVLIEGLSKKGYDQVTGHTPCNKTVNFSDEKLRVGQLVHVNIADAFSHSLLGAPSECCRKWPGEKGGILHAA